MLQRHFEAIAFPNIPAPYDLLVETKEGKFLKCQVKTADSTSSNKGNNYWQFRTTHGTQKYTKQMIDFFAFVILPKRKIVFGTPESMGKTFWVPMHLATSENEQKTLESVLGKYL